MPKPLLVAALALLTALCVACSSPPDLPRPTELVGEGAPPQLVTEEYLRRQLDISIAQVWALPLAEMMAGPAHRFPTRITGVKAETWDRDRMVHLTVVMNDGPGRQRHIPMTFTFNGPNYDTDSGSVTTGTCTELPGAGVATTGEFTTIHNKTDAEITHQIDKTITESTATSISLSESLELSSGVTVEAGTDAAKVSANLQTTFGISKDKTTDHSVETSVTVMDTFTVSPGRDVAITFTTNDAAVNCDVSINAEGDWSDIRIWIGFPEELHKLYNAKGHDYWGVLHSDKPVTYSNIGLVFKGDVLADNKGGAELTFTEGDQLYRLLKGFDVRCPDCKDLRFTPAAKANLERMADPSIRWVSFEGVRHETSKKDASYTALDVTGQDETCVADTLGTQGRQAATLDADGDGKLDACQ